MIQKTNNEKIIRCFKVLFLKYRILLVLGSLAIFGAWIIQNFQENNIKSRREELLQNQNTINHLFDARRVWLESIYTHNAIKNDSVAGDKTYFTKVYNYLETSFAILENINEVLITDTIKLKKLNDNLAYTLFLCGQYYQNNDYDKLSTFANYVNSDKEDAYNINSKFALSGKQERKILKGLIDEERKANNWYLLTYILGSILIAIDYLVSKIKQQI